MYFSNTEKTFILLILTYHKTETTTIIFTKKNQYRIKVIFLKIFDLVNLYWTVLGMSVISEHKSYFIDDVIDR